MCATLCITDLDYDRARRTDWKLSSICGNQPWVTVVRHVGSEFVLKDQRYGGLEVGGLAMSLMQDWRVERQWSESLWKASEPTKNLKYR